MLSTIRPRVLTSLLAVVLATGAFAFAPAGAATATTKGCGRSAASGVTTRHLTVDGTDREYLLSIPDGYDPTEPAPLLLNFHGLSSNMFEQSAYTDLDARAGARGYVVLTPNGQGDVLRRWSLNADPSENTDVAFVQALLRATQRSLCIDRDRIYATGMSNGAMFSTLLACALPGRLAAIAPVAGVNAMAPCNSEAPPIDVLAFHGTADPVVPYAGGKYFGGAADGGALGFPEAKPVDDAIAAWAAFDGCAKSPSTTNVAADVQRVRWRDCPKRGTVVLYRVLGGGHTWPGAIALPTERLGATTASIDATALILDFFEGVPLSQASARSVPTTRPVTTTEPGRTTPSVGKTQVVER